MINFAHNRVIANCIKKCIICWNDLFLLDLNMPTVLFIYGWRLFFYANESNEPIHIHAEKGDMECKYWLLVEEVEIKEEFSFNMSPNSKREIKKIIYQNFDLIIESWNNFFKK